MEIVLKSVHLLNLLIPVALFAFLANKSYESLPKRSVYLLFVLWLVFWSAEYWVLGPASHIHYYDEADIGAARYLHDGYFYIGGSFLHGLQGGADYYASQFFGGQYISLERLLLSLLPLWIAILIHKLMVVSISAFGGYTLLRKVTRVGRFDAFCFTSFLSVFNPYALYSTIHHGIGYAGLALAIYMYVFRSGKKHYLASSALLSLLIATSTTPTHSFLPMFGGIILSALLLGVRSYPKFVMAIVILLTLTIVNWSEVLFGLATYGAGSGRAITGSGGKDLGDLVLGGLPDLFWKTDYVVLNIRFSSVLTLMVVTLALAFFSKVTMRYKISLNILLAIYLPSLVYLVPWVDLGLPFINAVRINLVSYYLIIPTIIMGGLLTVASQSRFTRLLPILFLAVAIFIACDRKGTAFYETLNGNQLRLTSIGNLRHRDWEPGEAYRVVSTAPYVGFHPNFLWAYGIETLDGYLNMIPGGYVNFWHYGIHRNKYGSEELGGNMYITYTEDSPHAERMEFFRGVYINDMDELVDMNLLRLANVSDIISYFPVRGKGIRKVSGPDDSLERAKGNRSVFEKSIARLSGVVKPENVFVYAIDDYSQRAFFPETMQQLEASWNLSETYRFISSNYHRNPAFTSDLGLVPAAGRVLSITEVPNGYQISVKVSRPGVFVVNVFPLPYWRAYVDGVATETFPINVIHLGLNVPAGKQTISIKYERQLLRTQIGNSIMDYFRQR